jgi:hypothetical protein
VVSSPPRSLAQRTSWYVALGLAAALLLPSHASARFVPQVDAPLVTYTIDGTPGNNGWYLGNGSDKKYIVVHWSVSGDVTSTTGCEPAVQINDPNTGTTLTCTATGSGGTTTVTTALLKVDATRPTTSVTPSPAPNGAGWYRSPVTLQWSGTDSTSGVASCTSALTYSTPDTTGTPESGTCTDNAGNQSTAALTIHYDSTAPTTTPSPSPAPNGNGWVNSVPVQVSWRGSDATSGIASCDGATTYNGGETSGTTVTGSCTDLAGNTATGSFPVRYDKTPPATTAVSSPAPNAAGWYRMPVTISGSGSDTLSGIASCSSTTYSGPDTAGSSRSVTCTDKAGNSSSDSYTVKYDATPPALTTPTTARSPDSNGWFNHGVRIDWHGTDAPSGIASCTSLMYTAPDGANAAAHGSCTDAAGNVAASDFPLQYDSTPPTVAVNAARSADHDGWYNRPVSISWSGTDATSGVTSCTAALIYSGPDSSNASSGGGCTDRAGNSASPPALSFRYDATPPAVLPVASRAPDSNGWYNHGFSVDWSGADPVSGIASCSSYSYSGPDSAAVQPTGSCTDKAGNTSAPTAFGFRFDATPPTAVTAGPARPPDHDGWYNRPLAVKWTGSDALSGVASCTTGSYGGPTNAATALTGSCTDQAGNTSGPVGYAFKYDSTPPAFAGLSVTPRDNAVTVRWRTSGATEYKVTRKPGSGGTASSVVYGGPAGSFTDRKVENYVRYTYVVTAEDDAGNALARSASATPMPVLFAPRPGARVSPGSVPLLEWRPARKARYYNVQLWLGGRAVGSWWPARPRLELPGRWRFAGAAHTLEPGSYAWYVWPGRGPRRLGRYGPLLGKSTFVVGSG